VHARDYLGSTVLHNAAAQDLSAGVMCCLLKADADANAVNTNYDTAAEVAEVHKHIVTATLLRRAESNRGKHFKLQQRAPMLPMHLLLNPDHSGWRCSTDMTARSAVFGCLNDMALFDTELDKIELLQCVEFNLYSTAIDLAEYGDLGTVPQRAAAVLDTVRADMQERAAEMLALNARLTLEKMSPNKERQAQEETLASEQATQRIGGSAEGDSVQQRSDADNASQ
jgi:hypothetical protein